MASTSLDVSAATTVKSAVATSDVAIGILRLRTGSIPRRARMSTRRPPKTPPATPNAKGIEATQPVLPIVKWRSISR